MLKMLSLLLLTGLVLSCGEEPPPPPPPPVEFRLEATALVEGAPLPLVPIQVDGSTVGYTDKNGEFSAVISERPGNAITLRAGEIPGYRYTSSQDVTETLRLNSSGIGIPVSLSVNLESLKKEYMVWISLNCDGKSMPESFCAGLPILKNGEEIARTDEFGQAHAIFKDVPQTEVEILVQTPEFNELTDRIIPSPARPKYKITLDFTPQVYLIEESFANNHQSARRAPPVRRINKPKTKPKPKPKPKPKDEIDLW